jgi:predicted acylesterase/phospholipase RssA
MVRKYFKNIIFYIVLSYYSKMSNIKHLVISGGGPILFQTLGTIHELERNNIFLMKDIETIYGTSAGSLIGVILCLKYDWETIQDYFIKRPCKDVFPFKVQSILDIYSKKGLYDETNIEKVLKPLFEAKNISLNITLKELFIYSNIELHFFTFEINEFKTYDISYLTHPDLKVVTAVQMSCSIPILFVPIFIDNQCFIDGGIVANYPLEYCIQSGKKIDEILGFKNKYNSTNTTYINTESSILDFLLSFLYKAILNLNKDHIQPYLPNEIHIETNYMSIESIKSALYQIDERKRLYELGKTNGTKYIEFIREKERNT